jgi:transcriptional activator SPT7
MASRGRKAPSKKGKGTSTSRKGLQAGTEGTPGAETKPSIPSLSGAPSNLKNEFLRADSDVPMENGFTTPPPGSLTPLGINGILGSGAPPSQADISELDGMSNSINGLPVGAVDDPELDDEEYKTWKQITKKDRAIIAAERHRLFRSDGSLNVEEPAILRSRAGMRRWMRHRKAAAEDRTAESTSPLAETKEASQAGAMETLAEGIEEEQDRDVPDYYDPVSAIPDLNEHLKWVEDSEGNLVDQSEEYLRIAPAGLFVQPESNLSRKMDSNMKQMQNMRKICSKIGIVKQMQLQSQVCRFGQ